MKVFNLYNQQFTINDDFEKYNLYRKIYNEAALMMAEEFKNTYLEHITNLDILITKVPEYAMLLIKNTISKTIEMLVDEEIMTIDEDIFLKKYYYKYFNFEKYYDPILEKYIEITEASDKLEEYREIQKMTRSKWQGGGFGVSGAIKGAMTAGALNIGTDFLRSFGDSSQSRKDKNQINSMKKAIYNDKNTFLILHTGIYNCIFGIFYGFIDELIFNNVIEPVNLNPKESEIIFQNTSKYARDSEKVFKNIIQCLMMNPYNFELYKIIMAADDQNKEIIEMAIYFGFENQVNTILKEKYKKQISYTINLPEASAEEITDKILKYIELMNISNIDYSETIKSLVKKLLYIIDSKEELESIYSILSENLSIKFSDMLSDIEKIFNNKLDDYDENEKDTINESCTYNTQYKAIYNNPNHTNTCKLLKSINSNSSVFAFSSNGEKFAYINNDENNLIEEILVFDSSLKKLSSVIDYQSSNQCHVDPPIFITFTQNMDYIFTVTEFGEILKWDMKLSKVINRYNSKLDRISSVVYCSSKDSIILGGMNQDANNTTTIEVFNITKSESVRLYTTNDTVIHDLSCSSDGKYITYTSGWNFEFRSLDLETGKFNTSLVNDETSLAKFANTNKIIAYKFSEGKIAIWDYSKNKSKCYLNCGNTDVTAIAFSPNDRLLAVECSNNYIQLWDLEEQVIKVTLTGYENISSNSYLSFSPDGKLLISNDEDTRLVIWSINDTTIATNELSSSIEDVHHNNIQINSENSNVNLNKNHCDNETTEKKLPKKSIVQWFSRLALSLIIFLGLALLAYNKIGNIFIKYGLVIFLVASGIKSLVDSISELQEMNKKNNC